MALQEFVDVSKDESCLDYQYVVFTEEGERTLNDIGNLPAVYPSQGTTTTLVSGILQVAQTASRPTWEHSFNSLMWIFEQLQYAMPRKSFGKDVAEKLVAIGQSMAWEGGSPSWSAFHPKNAASIVSAIFINIVRRVEGESARPGQAMPGDKDVAASVEAGMIEFFIDLLISASHTAPEPIEMDPVDEVLTLVGQTLEASCSVALSRRTNEQLQKSARSIHTALRNIPKTPTYFRHSVNQNRDLIGALLERAASVKRGTDTQLCRFCLTSGTDFQCCSKCQRATYCSRECQVEHWKVHKKECKMMQTNRARAEKKGVRKSEARAEGTFEENLSASGNKLFFSELPNIALQASLRRMSILDCVVVMDFTEARPTIETKSYIDFLRESEEDTQPEQHAHTSGIVHRNRENGALTAICYAYAADGGREGLLKTYPTKSARQPRDPSSIPEDIAALSSPWLRQQRMAERDPKFQRILNDDEMRNATIEFLMRPGSKEDPFASREQEQEQYIDPMTLLQKLFASSNVVKDLD